MSRFKHIRFVDKAFWDSSCEDVAMLMLANAACSLRKGLDEYSVSVPNKSNYKYAVLSIAHSIEVLLKARLVKENKELILEKPKDKLHELSDFKTVTVKRAIDLLGEKARINVAPNDSEAVEDLMLFRNDIVHFAFLANDRHLNKLLCYVVSFWWQFLLTAFEHQGIRQLLTRKQFEIALGFDNKLRKAEMVARGLQAAFIMNLSPEQTRYDFDICDECMTNLLNIDMEQSQARCRYCGQTPQCGECEQCGSVGVKRSSVHHILCKNCFDRYIAV